MDLTIKTHNIPVFFFNVYTQSLQIIETLILKYRTVSIISKIAVYIQYVYMPLRLYSQNRLEAEANSRKK